MEESAAMPSVGNGSWRIAIIRAQRVLPIFLAYSLSGAN
jgi:hypothetical protein